MRLFRRKNRAEDDEMSEFVEKLRKDYKLTDPTDLSPSDLRRFREETQPIRDAVVRNFDDGLRNASRRAPLSHRKRRRRS